MENLKLDGTLLGAAGGALWWFTKDAQDRDERLRSAQLDNRAISNRLNLFLSSADWIRQMSPAVRDATVGIAAATPTTAPAQTVPPITTSAARPDLSAGANVSNMQWPPTVGVYDAAGRTAQPGELSLSSYVQTYQEPRAWNQGLTQAQAPTGEQLQQLFWSAQGMSSAVMGMKRSAAEWQSTWKAALTGGAAASSGGTATPSSVDPHQDPSKAPSVVAVGTAKIYAMNDPASGAPPASMNSPQTDSANRWRIQCSTTGHAAQEKLARVSFRSEYILRTPGGPKSIQPVVITNRPQLVYADNVTSSGFDLYAGATLGGSAVVDVYVSVNPGVAAELLIG